MNIHILQQGWGSCGPPDFVGLQLPFSLKFCHESWSAANVVIPRGIVQYASVLASIKLDTLAKEGPQIYFDVSSESGDSTTSSIEYLTNTKHH